jgi:hypothetical protein
MAVEASCAGPTGNSIDFQCFRVRAVAISSRAPRRRELDEMRKHPCDIQVPEGFSCAVLFDVGMSYFDGMVVSIVGEDVSRCISVECFIRSVMISL